MASLMLYIKVSVQEQQKSTKSSEVCRERKNVEKSRRQTIKTGTSKDTDAPSIMNGNAEVIIVRFRKPCLKGTEASGWNFLGSRFFQAKISKNVDIGKNLRKS